MSIAPIERTIVVKATPAKAFELFTSRMQAWWPGDKTIGKQPRVALVLEPWVEGRWFERDASGEETLWGRVLAWEPPRRILLAWQIGTDWAYHPELLTELELTFATDPSGGTRVTLTHRHLERLGQAASEHRMLLDGGWPSVLSSFQILSDSE